MILCLFSDHCSTSKPPRPDITHSSLAKMYYLREISCFQNRTNFNQLEPYRVCYVSKGYFSFILSQLFTSSSLFYHFPLSILKWVTVSGITFTTPIVLSCARTKVIYFGNSVPEIYTTQRDHKPVPFCVHHCQMSI